MNEEKKNQVFLILIIIMMLIIVSVFITKDAISDYKNRKNDELGFKVKQIYSSDYDLLKLNSKYYLGLYKDKVNVVINNEGKEVFKSNLDFEYNGIYYKDEDQYYIVDYQDNIIEIYLFENEKINDYDVVDNFSYAKPIIYRNNGNEVLCGFVSYDDKKMKIYSILSKEIYTFDNVTLLGDLYEDDRYYINNDNYLIVKDNKNLVGVIDFSGKQVIKFIYKDILCTGDSFIVVNKKDKYGVLDKKGNNKIKLEYRAIYYYNDYYLVVNKKNKMALYDKKYKNMTGFKLQYDNLIEYNLRSNVNSVYMNVHDDKVFVVNNYLESINGTEYDHHNLYVVRKNGKFDKYNEYGLYVSSYVFLYDKDGNVKIYDLDMNLLGNIKIDDLRNIKVLEKVEDSVLEVEYYDNSSELKYLYININDFSLVEREYGELVFSKNDFYGYIKHDDKDTFYLMHDGDKVYEISGSHVEVNGNFLIVDHELYEITM